MSETIYRKYRPQTFKEVTGQNHIKATIMNQLSDKKVAHAYLFSGPRGVGKTTIARLLAKAVNCERLDKIEPCNKCHSCQAILDGKAMDVFEIDAASHTGVDNVRENVIDTVRFAPTTLKRKVYIIDEVHMLSTSAFNALLKTLEEPPAHAMFIMATTEIHKIPETIISRCQRFDFHRITVPRIIERLNSILKSEGVDVDDDLLQAVARRSEGCLRDAESLLNQILAIGTKKITLEDASFVIPATNINTVLSYLEALVNKNAKEAIKIISDAVDQGIRIGPFAEEMVQALRYTLFISIGATLEQISIDDDSKKRLRGIAESLGSSGTHKILTTLIDYENRFKNDQIQQLPFDLMAVKICGDKAILPSSLSQDAKESVTNNQAEESLEDRRVSDSPKQKQSGKSNVTPSQSGISPSSTSATSISFEDIKKNWQTCCDLLKDRSATLPVVLDGAELVALEGDTLHIHVKFAFLADQLNEIKNRKLLDQTILEVLKQPVKIRATTGGSETKELVDDLISEFGGEVLC